ncbi:MAG: glycosyltransferase family 2 protein [Lachnospiraceae bacterium]|nr:glycosyltransferase family 2 protein [Lachnospiraceae bacterium]
MIKVSVVIPNLNGMEYLNDCLTSLMGQEGAQAQVILVDNGSADESVAFVRERFPQVQLEVFPENRGFCEAVNAGIRLTKTEYVILLNNDTVCDPHFVRELVEGMRSHPDAFSCQAGMRMLSEPDRMDDAGDYYCALGWAFALGKGQAAEKYRRERRIFSACAGAAIYRMSALRQTGLFDPQHFAYLEDLDIGWRARILGYKNYFIPQAIVYHAGSGTSGSRYNAFKVRHSARNSVYVIRKNMPVWQILLNLPMLAAGFAVKTVFFARKGLGGVYVKGLLEGLRMKKSGIAALAFGQPGSAEEGKQTERRAVLLFSGTAAVYVRLQLEMWHNLMRRLCDRG